ncbi:MAG: GlmU family protein [Chitinophagales bacterium]
MQVDSILFFDDISWKNLLPLTLTRPVADIRIGITKIAEKWTVNSSAAMSYLCEDYLQEKFPFIETEAPVYINGSCIPDARLISTIESLQNEQALIHKDIIIAFKTAAKIKSLATLWNQVPQLKKIDYTHPLIRIHRLWDIFRLNDIVLRNDFLAITSGRTSAPWNHTNTIIGEDLFIEAGAVINAAVINTTTGPVYIGKEAEIMEGSVIRGPLALCEHSTLKMAAKIYGATTIGPHCKVGGEVNNAVLFGFSNKAHDGFLGNAVIGEWCNLGADTNTSNLKNNYAEVKLWDYSQQGFINTGLQFCGLIMADHSKCGINTMFNTGTVVGFSANIFGDGYPRNYIPSFSWGGAAGFTVFKLNQAMEVAAQVMQRRNISFSDADQNLFNYLFTHKDNTL